MELTVKEIRTLQLALINMEDGLNESGIAKMKALSEKLEQEVTRLTKRAADVCHESPSKTHSWYGSSQGYVCEHCGTRR